MIGSNIVTAIAKYGSKITNISINCGDGTKLFYWRDNIARI
jgi:hypothetical protein